MARHYNRRMFQVRVVVVCLLLLFFLYFISLLTYYIFRAIVRVALLTRSGWCMLAQHTVPPRGTFEIDGYSLLVTLRRLNIHSKKIMFLFFVKKKVKK